MSIFRWPQTIVLAVAVIISCYINSNRVLATATASSNHRRQDDDQEDSTTGITPQQSLRIFLEETKQDAIAELLPSGFVIQRKREGHGAVHPAWDTLCEVDMEISRMSFTRTITINGDGDDDTPQIVIKHHPTQEDDASTSSRWMRPEDATGTIMPVIIRDALVRMVEGDWWELYTYNDKHNNNNDEKSSVYLDVISLELGTVSDGDKIPKGEYHDCEIARILLNDDSDNDNDEDVTPIGNSQTCDERDSKFIAKIVSQWEYQRSVRVEQELVRLKGMLSTTMKQPLALWVRRRIHILKQFLKEDMRQCRVHFQGDMERRVFHSFDDCHAQEQEYVWKVLDKTTSNAWKLPKLEEEIRRLRQMSIGNNNMDAGLASWVRRRVRILKQIWKETRLNEDEVPAQESPNGDVGQEPPQADGVAEHSAGADAVEGVEAQPDQRLEDFTESTPQEGGRQPEQSIGNGEL